jgi:hypothetical protein
MTTRVRLVLLACTALFGLVLAGGAMAAFVPTLAIGTQPPAVGSAGTTSIRVTVPRDDDALFRAQILVPAGYTANFSQSVGAQIGTTTAQVQVREPIAGAVLPITGSIQVVDPATYAAQAAQCTQSASQHAANWVLVLQAAGQELRVPVWVDPAPAALSSIASYVINVCLPTPHVPPPVGATFGAKLIDARLNTTGVFTAPTSRGSYRWQLIATPWPNGPGLPNAAGTVNAQGITALPGVVNLGASSRRGSVVIAGRVLEGGAGVAGSRVNVRVANRTYSVRTSGNGSFRLVRRFVLRRNLTITATANVPQRTSTTCSSPSPFPTVPTCVTETRGSFIATRTIRHRVR